MPKRTIAVDVDDVLFPFVPEIIVHYNGLRGAAFRMEDFSKYHFSEVWGISEEEANEIVASYLTKDVVHLLPVPGAKAGSRQSMSSEICTTSQRESILLTS